jgi:hypothetical protein
VRVFDGATGQRLAGPVGSFFAYDRRFTGGVFVASGDVNGDGADDIITGAGAGGGPHVRVFDGLTGERLQRPVGGFFAFDGQLTFGVRVASGDVDGDGRDDVITALGAGFVGDDPVNDPLGQAEVRVFSGMTGNRIRSFVPFEAGYHGGVHLATVRFDQDTQAEIIVSKANGDGRMSAAFEAAFIDPFRRSQVSLYQDAGPHTAPKRVADFNAYGGFGGSVRVAALDRVFRELGDEDYDGPALISGPGPGGGPQVRLRSIDLDVLDSVFAYEQTSHNGVWVAAG